MRRRGLVTPARSLVLGGDTGASLPAAGTETSGTRRERGAQRQAEPGGHAAARARARVRGVPSGLDAANSCSAPCVLAARKKEGQSRCVAGVSSHPLGRSSSAGTRVHLFRQRAQRPAEPGGSAAHRDKRSQEDTRLLALAQEYAAFPRVCMLRSCSALSLQRRGAQRQAEPGGHAAARARARVRGVPSGLYAALMLCAEFAASRPAE